MQKINNDAYNSYEKWKGWDELFVCTIEQGYYFSGECHNIKVTKADIFEIGFGSGSFLAWAKERGAASLSGAEINNKMAAEAKEHGVDLIPDNFEQSAKKYKNKFDTITAFDVFEHFTLEEIINRLHAIEMMLKPGGNLIMRFPNGQSPFGLPPQNGDPTHKTALSCSIFEQLIQNINLEIIRYSPSFRVKGPGIKGIIRRLRYFARDLIKHSLNLIYATNLIWDPVVVLVLHKPYNKS